MNYRTGGIVICLIIFLTPLSAVLADPGVSLNCIGHGSNTPDFDVFVDYDHNKMTVDTDIFTLSVSDDEYFGVKKISKSWHNGDFYYDQLEKQMKISRRTGDFSYREGWSDEEMRSGSRWKITSGTDGHCSKSNAPPQRF